ncbi:MAG: hypothetical protein CMG59_02310 [Candidatus Marinimicrobia bacterium]|nr:hypothetical protein [Candidatus Neomarinimicrobiota bacterium]|tara:strand:+ start:3672 stop:5291 length:1620 start_codon:yes stop_codon:yes gene_type:complete
MLKYTFFILSSIILTNEIDTLENDFKNSKISKNLSLKDILISSDSLDSEDLFEVQLYESKILLAESIIADLTGDTIEAKFQFDALFESLSNMDAFKSKDEFQELEMNRLLTASIDYYEKDSITIDKIETGLSVSLLRDRLNQYIYHQTIDDLEYVDETVEIIPGHIPITYNRKVASIIKFFQKDGRKSMAKWLNRMNKYKEIILPILEKENVPPEIFYLAMIESGLNPRAYSYAHASGIWQFIKSTGRVYGLKQNWWVDERRDLTKATHAASSYLKDLYKEFDDWYLAFAAYNCGSSRVERAIKRHGSRNYWDLHTLPSQTRSYVPNIMAAIIISNNPKKYGFQINSEDSFDWIEKETNKSVKLKTVADCANIDIKELQKLNPEIKQATIPPLKKNETYILRLPTNISKDFDSLFALVKAPILDELVFIDHKVRKGESLWIIARKYKARVSDIVSINKISDKGYIRPGQNLKIPTKAYDDYKKSTQSRSKKIFYTVRRGDTLSEIAEKYRTSVKNIRKWNGLRNDRIIVGQKLKIWTKK